MSDKATFTYQTRLKLDDRTSLILDKYAQLFGKVERSLFASISAGNSPLKLKNSFLIRFGITARQYNACRAQLAGKIDSCKHLQPLIIAGCKERIHSLEKTIEKLTKRGDRHFSLHQKKRRLETLKRRLQKREQDRENKAVRLCFGSKKLFHAQFHLEQNNYSSHEEWKREWEYSRNSQFFVLGSKDETAGNQSCAATPEDDNTLTLRLRLPNALAAAHGKFLTIPNVSFPYGQKVINASLNSCLERKHAIENKNHYGQAISYRFKKDKKGWCLYASTDFKKPETITRENLGAIGIDINADHLALVEIDRFGNPIYKKTIPLNTYGKTKNQILASIGSACAQIVKWAEETKKPLIYEKLDFQKKKASLKEQSYNKQKRALSSFAYNKILSMLKAKAYRHGIATHPVNPAYTSIIGCVKFSQRYGLTKHHAAGLCIARRYFGFSELPPKSSAEIPDGKESRLTLSLPARNRDKHVWSFWGAVGRKIPTALAAHFRAMKHRSSDPPLPDGLSDIFPEVADEISAREPLAALFG